MKNKVILVVYFFLCIHSLYTQAIWPNDYTSTQIDSININSAANEGDIYRDWQNNNYYIGTSSGLLIPLSSSTKSVVLNRSGGNLLTANNTYLDLPINGAHIQTINSSLYSVVGDGQIRVLQGGVYLISGELSTSNMPSGNTKYILALYINGTLRGYMSRGFANLPSNDFWGTTGMIMYTLQTNDIVNIKYVINAGGTILNAALTNIGITKL